MKKFLSLILISSITVFSYAGDTTSIVQKSVNQVTQSVTDAKKTLVDVAAIPDSASLSFSKIYTDVKTGISALASSLKVGAEHVYEILVMQQIVNSIIFLILLLLAPIFLTLSYKFWGKTKWESTSSYSGPDLTGGRLTDVIYFIIFGVSGFILLGVGLTHLDVIVMGLINPEYGAIKDIISIVK